MKNILLTIGLLLALLFTQSACDPDSFSQVVEIEIPEHESLIVLKGLWSNMDTVLQLLVSNSLGIIDESEFTLPQDAKVQLFKEGNLVGDLFLNIETANYEIIPPSGFFEEAGVYTIEAQFGTYKAVKTEQQMPSSVEIKDVEYEKDGALGEGGEKVDKHIISFDDPANQENYYAVIAYRRVERIVQVGPSTFDTISRIEPIFLETNNPIATPSSFGVLFSDEAFNGQSYSLRATAYPPWGEPENLGEEIIYRLMNVSKDTYLYYKSLVAYSDAHDNPFAEPATVYSNVEDGYGIFGLMAVDTMVITP